MSQPTPETRIAIFRKKEIRKTIHLAHSLKLKVILKPAVDPLDGEWRGKIEFKNAIDNVNAFVADCQADIFQWCSKVAIGEGRILACLEKNKKQVSPACRKDLSKVHGDLGKAGQIPA